MDITVFASIVAIIGGAALALGIYQLGFNQGKAMGRRLNRIEREKSYDALLSPGLSIPRTEARSEMSAYNPIAADDIERVAALGGWEVTSRPTNADATVVLTRTEEHGEVEIKVSCRGRNADEVEIGWWSCTELDGYDSRDDELDHRAPEAWQPTVALGSLISRLLRPARPVLNVRIVIPSEED